MIHTRISTAARLPFAVLAAGVVLTAVGALNGCTTSSRQHWAQNAPTIRPGIPAARQVQLGAWGEGTDATNGRTGDGATR